ncbi:hypothetical protein D3C75_1237730 [compost metagenome]
MGVADKYLAIIDLNEVGHELKHIKQNVQIVVVGTLFGNNLVVGVASQRSEDYGNRFATLSILVQLKSPFITMTFEYLHDTI